MSTRAAKAIALLFGIACHATFLAAVASMAFSLFVGMQTGRGPFHGTAAVAADLLLLLHFPLLHSFLLAPRGRRWLARAAPAPLGAALRSTTYVLVASLQLLFVFLAWSPSGIVWGQATGAARTALCAGFGLSWLLLARSMADSGLAIQAGWLGWTSVWRGREPDYGPMPERGLFRVCRQPIYVAFALILWTVPTWTPDGLAIAASWTAYALLGPRHKEARYLRLHGAAFEAYRRRVPYWLPWPRPLPAEGAPRPGRGTSAP